jgi:hypothetical protein
MGALLMVLQCSKPSPSNLQHGGAAIKQQAGKPHDFSKANGHPACTKVPAEAEKK